MTRPTADRTRESIFNILAPRISGARFLDAYAGTGAVGIEALSRGATRAVFVEADAAAARVVRANLESLGILDAARVIRGAFVHALAELERTEEPFDVAYLDPPYAPGELLRALRLVGSGSLIAPDGLIVAEHERFLDMPRREGDFSSVRSARYGRTMLTIYARS